MASALRDRYGRGIAIVGQDNLRRTVLRERDVPGGAYIGLVDTWPATPSTTATTRSSRASSTPCTARACSPPCGKITAAAHFYYLDVPFGETIRRHATKPQASEYGRAEMSAWYRGSDLLPGGIEDVIPATSTLDATVDRILRDTRLPAPGAVAPAPPPG